MRQCDLISASFLPAQTCGQSLRSGHQDSGTQYLYVRKLAAEKTRQLFAGVIFLFFCCLTFWQPASFAQLSATHNSVALNEVIEADHVRISWLAPDQFADDPAAQNATLGIYFEPDPEWHVYWRNPGDSGNRPRFQFNASNLNPGEILWPYPQRLPVAHLVNLGYEGAVAYLFKAGVNPLELRNQTAEPDTAHLSVELEWLVCKEECIPGFATLTLTRPIHGEHHIWDAETKNRVIDFNARVPASEHQSPWEITCAYWADNGVLTLNLAPVDKSLHVANLTLPDVFPLQGDFVNPAAPTISRNGQSIEVRFDTFAGARVPEATGFVLVANERAWEFPAVKLHRGAFVTEEPSALWLLLLSAFIGGIILNLMPCVFPVLSIKLFSLIKAPGQGAALTAHRVREGLLYTAGVLVTFAGLGVLFLLLRAGGAAVGWGFQLQSPMVVLGLAILFWLMALSFLGNFEFGTRLMQLAGTSKSSSSFMTGVLAVFVAAPCTGPFMGAALGAAAVLPALSAMAIFLGLGLGLAAPFLLLAISPQLSSRLPKPGPWMETLRQFLAFPLFATVLWLLWVLSHLLGDNGWLLGGSALLLLSFAIWLGKSPRRGWRTLALVLALLTIVGTLVQATNVDAPDTVAGNSEWQPFNNEVISRARANGQAVFIDFTAAWCITCQVNKKVVLDTAAADGLFSKHNVLRIRADWTRYDPEITAALAAFGRNSVPVYVFYPADGGQPKVLPQVLTVDMIRALF
jgi:DsbC/DsbD-like thiol-disulfide interchange protein/cytochrome c biogenesis protein CcdA